MTKGKGCMNNVYIHNQIPILSLSNIPFWYRVPFIVLCQKHDLEYL